MLSTYYIYYIVTTYYVVNGITIVNYLHTDNAHNGGNAWYIATIYATGKRGLLCVYAMLCGVPCELYATG